MVKVGLVGYGFMGHMHAQCHESSGLSKIVALADIDPAKRSEAEEKYGCQTYATIEEMLEKADIEVVDICTPTYLHLHCVSASAKAGKDILCEKPMALNVEECDKMIADVKAAGVKLMIAQVIRFWPEYQVIKDIIDSGKYGKVKWVSARRLSPPPTWAWDGWLSDPKRSGGAILDLHIHDIDYLIYILGMPKTVAAAGVQSEKGIQEVFTTGIEHECGANSYAEASLDLPVTYPFTMSIVVALETAALRFDTGLTPSFMVFPAEGEAYAPEVPEVGVGASSETGGNLSSLGGYFNEIVYFLNCIKEGKIPDVVTPEEAREAVRVCIASGKSVVSGEVVKP